MLRTTTVAALALTLFANTARAEEPPIVSPVPSPSIRTSIAQVRFNAPDHSLPVAAWQRSSRRNSTAQKVAAGSALGFLGLLGGAWIGAQIEGNCSCDDPGLKGAMIGAPIGAIAGAIAGVMLATR